MPRSSRTSRRRPPRQAGRGLRPRAGPIPKTAGGARRDGRGRRGAGRCHDLMAARGRGGRHHRAPRRDRRGVHPLRGAASRPSRATPASTPFPASICPSVNDQVVHAIPGAYALRDGDVLSLDAGVVLDGWVADAARTYAIGQVSPIAARLIEVDARLARARHRGRARPATTWATSAHAVQTEVEAAGFSVVQSLVGHGVGPLDARGAPGARTSAAPARAPSCARAT